MKILGISHLNDKTYEPESNTDHPPPLHDHSICERKTFSGFGAEEKACLQGTQASACTSAPHRHSPLDPPQFLKFSIVLTFLFVVTHQSRTIGYHHLGRQICPETKGNIPKSQKIKLLIFIFICMIGYSPTHLISRHHERHELTLKPF